MGQIHIRRAKLDDTATISNLFQTTIPRWQRINDSGQVEDLPYDKLSIYERWLHGGAWMSVETSTLTLSHLLRGAGLPFVAIEDDSVIGYLELFVGHEPKPFGNHLHIAHLIADQNHSNVGNIIDILLQDVMRRATQMDIQRVTVSFSGYDTDTADFYANYDMSAIQEIGRFSISAQTGQGFYKATDHLLADYEQIMSWFMPLGRVENARQHWESLWTRTWDAVDEIIERPIYRLRFSSGGRDAFLCAEQDLYNPRNLHLSFWSPQPITGGQVTAIRDWAYRQGYRTLTLTAPDSLITTLKLDVEKIPFRQVIYAVDV